MITETERLLMREPDVSDVGTLCDYHCRNASRFVPWDATPGDDPQALVAWILACHGARIAGRPTGFLAFERSTSRLVGVVTLHSLSPQPPSAMLSYSVDERYEGRGFGFEMVDLCVRYAFELLDLELVTAHVLAGNERSLRLLRRLGFSVVARSPDVPGLESLLRPHVVAALGRR
jgi:[ribosomal protein S5]-alanine N-acetyltransferase